MNRFDSVSEVREAYASRMEPEAAQLLAIALWRAILILAILSIAGSIAWGMMTLFSTLGALEPSAAAPHVSAPALDRAALAGTVSGLSQRSARYEEIKNAALSLPDPSK